MQRLGWIANRTQGMRLPGWPDIECFRNGVTMFIEVKRGQATVSKEQFETQQMLRKEGFKVCVWNEDDEHGLRNEVLMPNYLKFVL